MPETKSAKQKFAEFRPSKTLWFWSCVGCVALTMIIGFTLGGWVTGGTAKEMAATAAEEAQAELVAAACVEKFVKSSDFAKRLAKLKDAGIWQRSDIIEEGGWVTPAGMDEPLDDAAEICAEELAAMEAPVANKGSEKTTVIK